MLPLERAARVDVDGAGVSLTYDPYRHTGRTTRMVREAMMAAREGKTVVILAGNAGSAAHIRGLVGGEQGIRVLSNTERDDIDWHTETMRGLGQEGRLFIDHHARDEHLRIRYAREDRRRELEAKNIRERPTLWKKPE